MPDGVAVWWIALAGLAGFLVGGTIGWWLRSWVSPATKPSDDLAPALRLLAVLQREGRLLDFLLEPIDAYSDAQIGAAVREIHRKCREALEKMMVLEKVLPKEEGEEVTVEAGFDPSAIRLSGAVSGQPPFRGTVKHPGWRVRELRLPATPEGQDLRVVMPAEVEVA
jgi:hypothetical protein